MPSKKILVIDDEVLARERIRRFLFELNIPYQVDEACNGIEALEKIKSLHPEIILLDVQMPGLNGFEVLQQIEERNFHLIFQTAYDEYAIQAFEESACDYLLKPFSRDRFKKAIEKALSLPLQNDVLLNLERDHQRKHGYLNKIAVKQSGRMRIIDLGTVECFISRDHYTCIYSGTNELVSELSLGWLEERIDPNNFIRCHRNNIVAISQIKSIGDSNDSQIELKNGMKVLLSRNNRKRVLQLFTQA